MFKKGREKNVSEFLKSDSIDLRYGYKRVSESASKTGYLINMHSTECQDDEGGSISALDLFFLEMDGTRFKCTISYRPYFLVHIKENYFDEFTQYMNNKFRAEIVKVDRVYKEDLNLSNHLSGLKQLYIKLIFKNQSSLIKVRKILLIASEKNAERAKQKDSIEQKLSTVGFVPDEVFEANAEQIEALDLVLDIREHDVPYHVRVSIDLKIFCGLWYNIEIIGKNQFSPIIQPRPDILERPDPIIIAFDIETTKLCLKFPDANVDQIMMISYMVDGQGYLITNREIISVDVKTFEYTPKPEFEGNFIVFNEPNEMMTLQRFFNHIIEIQPNIIVTYNGDFFDWPFIELRASKHGLNMIDEIGFYKSREGVYVCRPVIHMDCLFWVKRDSYLPVGSHGLKAVAKAKLHYDPLELDPEEMCRMAVTSPQTMSNYSVSDAIATFYLYVKYVHPFIFALSTIIPMEPDEILRRGSGTLCETLLMVEAYHANIVYPNKQTSETEKFSSDGHLIDSETYVGGHVEAVECGVYRADIPSRFRLDRKMIAKLIENVHNVLEHAIVTEEGIPLENVTNLREVTAEIKDALQGLYDIPNRLEQPVIYHLDVGAMYPNIILTNRLQPSAIVDDADCAACDFNISDVKCKRTMKWQWRGEMLPATRNELQRIKQQLKMEKFPPIQANGKTRAFHELSQEDQAEFEKKRLSHYCRKVYKKTKVVKLEERTSTICQKENSFYVDTVRAFRDRRYDYKGLTKVAKAAVSIALKKGDAAEIKAAKSKEVLYDSLQLAHKCILNSFYGYVMRKGARWHSMPMAGIVCLTGSNIITKARYIIERIGRPLELDTDGIWCILPASFPQVLTIHATNTSKKTYNISYPNAVLNNMVREDFTNDQYHELLKDKTENGLPVYEIRSENSIFFEVDGPYLAMVLPAAKEEGKRLKKRYAVFNFDESIAELKGFEVKRRGELQLIKIFQSSVFESFLSGNTLEECYGNVAKIANYWLDVLYSHGQNLPNSELIELLSENRSMSKKLEDYGTQKSTSISTAKRLAEFLGDQMVKDAGLACKYVISKKPNGAPVTERAIPLAIFQCDPSVQRFHLRRWLRDVSMGDTDIRDIIDWNYYIERLSGAIQKIITIPAAMQGVMNPVPRVLHPDWLHKRMMESTNKLKQRDISEMFSSNKQSFNDLYVPNRLNIERIEKPTQVESTKRKIKRNEDHNYFWRTKLGTPPAIGKTRAEIVQWILFQKKKWSLQLNKKFENKRDFKRSRCDNHHNLGPLKSLTVSDFVKRSKKALSEQVWEIISMSVADDLGNCIIWAIVDKELHKIKLNIPRILYINQRSEKDLDVSFYRQKVQNVLPGSVKSFNVYRYCFEEKDFIRNGLNAIGNLSMADIEGIYESKISLQSRFLIELGCLCSMSNTEVKTTSNIRNAKTGQYFYENLKKCADTSNYLQHFWKKLKKIFLYQHHSLGKRQIWGLFLPDSKQAFVVILDKVRANQIPNMNNLYTSERTSFFKNVSGSSEIGTFPNEMHFESYFEVDLTQVYRHIEKHLRKYKDDRKGPTVLCLQTSSNVNDFRSTIPALCDFPHIKIQIADDTSNFNGLDWQRRTTRSMIRHFLNFNSVINLMLEQSRYLNIPIGNLPADPVLLGTDVFFARLLQKHNSILWWSRRHRPDFGGNEVEDHRLLTERGRDRVYFNAPGFYDGFCVALTVQNLAVSAILQSNKIQEMEVEYSDIGISMQCQTTLEGFLAKETERVQSNTNENSTFKILRTLVNGWLREVLLNQNVFADFHIAHFYRWTRSRNSHMYDPAICRTVNYLMEKLLIRILAEFKRLAVAVVFADFKYIIINSKKRTVSEALSYTDFIVQSLRKNELFHGVQLSFDQCWHTLVWLDSANFGGVKGNVPSCENNKECDIDTLRSLDLNFSCVSNISTHIEYNAKFNEFVALMLESLQEQQPVSESIRKISHVIFKQIIDLRKTFGQNNADIFKYIQTVVKVICTIDNSSEHVLSLKRNIFKVVGMNEFNKGSENTFTTEKFILDGVTCRACNEYRDIDLVYQHYAHNNEAWLCHRCLVAYDPREIETLVTEDVTRKILSYTLQDIECFKCRGVKKDNLNETCHCGGKFVNLLQKNKFLENASLLANVSSSLPMIALRHILAKVLK